MDVSIITINYNSSEDTIRLIQSLLKYIDEKVIYEIIVVDNASEADDHANLLQRLPNDERVKLVSSKFNLGFGGGNNFGYQFAKDGDYLLFINNDCEFIEDAVSPTLAYMRANPNVGLSGGQMLNANGVPSRSHMRIHTLGIQLMGLKTYTFLFGKIHESEDMPFEVESVSGAYLFFRKKSFNKIGAFDNRLFLYYEEMDVCLRLRAIKEKVMFLPQVSYKHFSGKSTLSNNSIPLWKEKELLISYSYVFRKHYGFLYWLILLFLKAFKYFIFGFLKPHYWQLLLFYLKGSFSGESVKYKNHHL